MLELMLQVTGGLWRKDPNVGIDVAGHREACGGRTLMLELMLQVTGGLVEEGP